MKANTSYEFGPFRLDTTNRSLTRDGQSLHLQPRTYSLLLMLIQNRDRVVTRDELINDVWSLNVSDGALNYQINQLRKILNDDASNPKYVQTYAKHGFRFIGEITELPVRGIETKNELVPAGEQGVYENIEEPEVDAGSTTSGHLGTRGSALTASAILNLPMSGNWGHIVINCMIYASLYAVAILIEVAYEFDQYGRRGLPFALLAFCWIFLTSLAGLSLAWKMDSLQRRSTLAISALVFVAAAGLLFAALCQFLPPVPITQLKIQAYTAQAAYLKDIYYFLAMALIFFVIPFHFVVSVQRELYAKRFPMVLKLLSGNKLSVPPKGTLYIRVYILGCLLFATLFAALYLHSHLLDNLSPGPYMNLFIILIYVRLILYLGLGISCLFWYYSALNEMRRQCLEIESLGLSQDISS